MFVEKKASLVFIPFPIVSHLVAAVKTAELLADRNECLSVTVLVMNLPIGDAKISSYIKNSPDSNIKFVQLPTNEPDFPGQMKSIEAFSFRFINSQKGPVRDAVFELMKGPKSGRLAGFVLDVFCTPMIDVANELGIPTYVFLACGSSTLGLLFHLQSLNDDQNQDLTEYEDSDAVISVPTHVNPVPARVWPAPVFDIESRAIDHARKFRETKGIIINTFLEFETHAIKSLSADEKIPPVYPLGPIIQDKGEKTDEDREKNKEIIGWLDKQPDSSVVFVCFGSIGCFEEDQVKEIALALEHSGQRFLWSLKKPPPKEKSMDFPGEYENPGEVLPEGFLERTMGIGKVIGWAPQMAVLSHPAVGGFVSHCGWNSTLESVWCGVPMAVWPLAAEQQANAFLLVKEFEMAVEIKMDYRKNSDVIVAAEEIEKAIRLLMDPENTIRVKVKELKEKSKKVLMEGGSSYNFLGRLIDSIMDSVS